VAPGGKSSESRSISSCLTRAGQVRAGGASLCRRRADSANGHAFLTWASGVFGSPDKRARGAAGGGSEDQPRDHADAESQDEQGGDQPDPGQQHSHEDGKTDGEYGDEKNGGHRVTVTFQPGRG
jgi:hypothetical protein